MYQFFTVYFLPQNLVSVSASSFQPFSGWHGVTVIWQWWTIRVHRYTHMYTHTLTHFSALFWSAFSHHLALAILNNVSGKYFSRVDRLFPLLAIPLGRPLLMDNFPNHLRLDQILSAQPLPYNLTFILVLSTLK